MFLPAYCALIIRSLFVGFSGDLKYLFLICSLSKLVDYPRWWILHMHGHPSSTQTPRCILFIRHSIVPSSGTSKVFFVSITTAWPCFPVTCNGIAIKIGRKTRVPSSRDSAGSHNVCQQRKCKRQLVEPNGISQPLAAPRSAPNDNAVVVGFCGALLHHPALRKVALAINNAETNLSSSLLL
jgi:hypothetical protein